MVKKHFVLWFRGFVIVWALVIAHAGSAQTSADRQQIDDIMDAQRICWNKGDLTCFMNGYWQSDSLMFIGSEVTYGYDSTLARYRRRYPDASAMGQLRFEVIYLDFLSDQAAFMIGKWFLQRGEGDISGHFTLLFRRIGGRWLITKDHSS